MTLALLLAAGCTSSGGDTAPSSPPASSPATTTPAPTSTVPTSPSTKPTPTVPPDVPTTGPNLLRQDEKPPVEPVAATKHTAAGAKAFAEFFIRTIDWGYATTSSAYMRHYFAQTCVACRSAADSIDKVQRAHHQYIGDRFNIRKTSPRSHGHDPWVVAVVFDVTSVEIVDEHGKYVDADGALTAFKETISLRWGKTGWFVSRMVPS